MAADASHTADPARPPLPADPAPAGSRAAVARRGGRRHAGRPTMKDVAARAGVGLKTVSRVVNGEAGVSSDTERRVQEAITSLGFRRNDSARVLRKGTTASVGLVLEDLADPFYSPLSGRWRRSRGPTARC